MLEPLGVSEQDELLYRSLLRNPQSTVDEIAERSDHPTSAIRRSLHRLEELGLLTRLATTPTRFAPVRPDVAVDVLVSRRQQELVHAQAAAQALLSEMVTERPHEPEELVEIVTGRNAVALRFLQLEQTVSSELLVLDRPPYAYDPREPNPYEFELLARGVRCRGIYAPEGLEIPGRLVELRALIEAGEQARTSPVVPMKMAIADRAVAIVPLSTEQVTDQALVVHASTVIDALIALFEMLWERALPLDSVGGAEEAATADGDGGGVAADAAPSAAQLSPMERDVLALMAAGLSDTAIARQVGVSTRTLSRHLASVMRAVGARTRFQAGVAAARIGLVR